MEIAKNTMVTLKQRVMDKDGTVLDQGEQPITYLHGGYNAIFPKIEAALEGKSVGDRVTVTLHPRDGVGEIDPALMVPMPLDRFSRPPEIGDDVEWNLSGSALPCRVIRIEDGQAILDANDSRAGKSLVFAATVTAVRPASPEEAEAAIHALKQAAAHSRETERSLALAREEAREAAEAAKLAEAKALDLVETMTVSQFGLRFHLIFRSQAHKLCWLGPLFLLPGIAIWAGIYGYIATSAVLAGSWFAWSFFAPALIRMAIDRWGFRFLFFDFSPNLNPSRLEQGIVTGGQTATILLLLLYTGIALFHLDHLSDLWRLLGADIAVLMALTLVLTILLPFLIMVLTAFRVRPVMEKVPADKSALPAGKQITPP